MKLFFTSDIHFGHANIIKYCNRPFADADEMDQEIILRWNETVAPEDHVIILGDLAMGKIADSLPLVSMLNGEKDLLPGNHDRCWIGLGRKSNAWVQRYKDVGLHLIGPSEFILPNGERIELDHFPYEGDSNDEFDRYPHFRPQDRGNILFHGHIHDGWKVNGRQVNVGMDVWDFRPVEWTTLWDAYLEEHARIV
jgi:calcineurin-like phosphoesterase family protein